MARYQNIDKDGNVIDTFIVEDETLRVDPDAVIKSRGPLKSRAPAAPEGYEHMATMEGDPDALVSDVSVHYYAKKGVYYKEKPSKLAGLKAVVAEAEARMESEVKEPVK